MQISYKWLKRYIDFNYTPRELAAVLTSVGLECDTVEEIEMIKGGLKGLKIGKVLTCVDHPDSDHLHVTTVDVGAGEPLQIVCGAPNVAAGQTVVVATIGTVLYDGDKEFQIKKSKMRGVESFGMICAEDEIGLGNSHDGIMVLPDGIAPGTPAADYFNVESDYCLEVELTPNRVDAASHYGVARDLKAYLADRIKTGEIPSAANPEIHVPDASSFHVDRQDGAASVAVVDTEGCPRYTGVTIRGIEVKESPDWLKELLTAAGQRPINNVVDITNFILLGIGQPLHCFDLDKVAGESIVVRTCEQGTPFVTLDGVEHKLDASDLMICDAEKPMCIAGVFGGLDSGVTEQTRNVFIESAWFNPTRIRRTARRHGLSTDASFRYERGTDPGITPYAARLAAVMIRELAGGEICGDLTDIYPNPVEEAKVDLSLDYCASLIGKRLPEGLITCILEALEFSVRKNDGNPDILHLSVPTYRVDVTRPCDVVEEILRIYGYNNVEFGTEMHANLSQRGDTDNSYALLQIISDHLSARGFMEIMNNSLSAASYYEDNDIFPADNSVRVMNPLSGDLAVLRQTLLYGGLESISHNINRKATDLRFYEYGNVYRFDPAKQSTQERPLAPYAESPTLALWLTGDYILPGWNRQKAEATVFDLRGAVDSIFRLGGISGAELKEEQGKDDIFSARLDISTRSGKELCTLGLISKKTLKKFDIERPVAYASINWDNFFRLASSKKVEFSPIPKTHPVRRDLALLLDKGISFGEVEQTIRKSEKKLLHEVALFDVYEGKNLPEGKKSYAVSITLQDNEKTLNDRQIDAVMAKIVENLKKNLGAELR